MPDKRAARRAKARRGAAPLRTPQLETVTAAEIGEAAGRTWFVIVTKPAREAHAVRALTTRGFDVYCPAEYRWRKAHWRHRASRRGDGRTSPAYARYVFVAGRVMDQGALAWHLIEDVPMISGFLADSLGRPVTVAAEAIAQDMEQSRQRVCRARGEEPGAGDHCPVVFPGDQVKLSGWGPAGEGFVVVRVKGPSAMIRRDGAEHEIEAEQAVLQVVGRSAAA